MNACLMRAHVVPMMNERRCRTLLGFSIDLCIACHIVPCKLALDPAFQHHLAHLCVLRAHTNRVVVFNEADQTKVIIRFLNDPGNTLIRSNYLKLCMIVSTKTVMVCDWNLFDSVSLLGGEWRMHLMDPFQHSFVQTTCMPNVSLESRVYDARNEFFKPAGSDTCVVASSVGVK